MNTVIVVVFSLLGIALIYNSYILYRNKKVGRFRMMLISMAQVAAGRAIYRGEYDIEKYYGLCDKYSYNDMLFSFKPLTLEAWYVEEEIKMLKGEK